MPPSVRYHGSDVWAVTSYFNPSGYERRLFNYRIFRERLAAPLVTVEWTNCEAFELAPGDADILIQVRSPDVLWQKERLLNLGLEAVPRYCRKIAWLDNDIVFDDDCWAARTAGLLDRVPLVQPYSQLCELPRDCWAFHSSQAFSRGHSLIYGLTAGHAGDEIFHQTTVSSQGRAFGLGFAWAARREVLARHGFYDAAILGSGDRLMANAAYGKLGGAVQAAQMNGRQAAHFFTWAEPYYQSIRGSAAYVEGDIFHLWHGEIADRRHRQRQTGLRPFNFDPWADIALDASGCWRWNTDKHEMHEYIRGYFASRNEDGIDRASEAGGHVVVRQPEFLAKAA